jgi:hypothetical protein
MAEVEVDRGVVGGRERWWRRRGNEEDDKEDEKIYTLSSPLNPQSKER